MKKLNYFVAGLPLILGLGANAQVLDFYGSLNYQVSIPLGETADYISGTSFRGFNFEFGRFLNDNISVGILFSWNVFYEELPSDTYVFEGITLTGYQYRYINAFPLMAGGRYFLMKGSTFRPYAGAGAGACIINQTTDMGLFRDENKHWHFGLYPEAGFIVQVYQETFINLGARYNYAFKSGDYSHSWLGFQAGVIYIY